MFSKPALSVRSGAQAPLLSTACEAPESGGKARNRTGDTRIFSPLLYQLSYLASSRGGGSKRTGRIGVNGIPPGRQPVRSRGNGAGVRANGGWVARGWARRAAHGRASAAGDSSCAVVGSHDWASQAGGRPRPLLQRLVVFLSGVAGGFSNRSGETGGATTGAGACGGRRGTGWPLRRHWLRTRRPAARVSPPAAAAPFLPRSRRRSTCSS